MIRVFDFLFALFGMIIFFPILLIIFIIGYFDTGSPIFKQQRVGKFQKPFNLYKFRSMPIDTRSVATHLAGEIEISRFGSFLRKSKLDELPQLYNVLKGDMSLVGPRPNLYNQTELIEERNKRGVYNFLPGITGLSQINEIDMSTPTKLAIMDAEMLERLDFSNYLKYIIATLSGKGQGDRLIKS